MAMFAVLCALFSLVSFGYAENIILHPNSTALNELALIMIQTDGLQPSQYIQHLSKVQDAVFDSIKLWVIIPDFSANNVDSGDIEAAIPDLVQNLRSVGFKSSNVILAGHLKGGNLIQKVARSEQFDYSLKGKILIGSFFEREILNDLDQVNVPTLTLGGELDGVCRITRMMEAYYHQVLPEKGTFGKHSVVVIPQISHSQFFTGRPNSYILSKDLVAEVTDADALEKITNVLSLFISSVTGDLSANAKLRAKVDETGVFLSPLMKAFEYEGFYYFKSPCYVKKTSDCITSSPFMSDIAQAILGDKANVNISNADIIQNIDAIIPRDYLPEILNSCNDGSENCVLRTTTVTEIRYEKLASPDLGASFSSAQSMAAKMNSRQRIYKAAGLDASDFDKLDGISLCRLVNIQSYKWALDHVGASTKARYEKIGQPLQFAEDKFIALKFYPAWDASDLEFKANDDSQTMVVTSPTIAFSTSFPVLGGYHDCKLLSPARAMEWIYIDSLRLFGSSVSRK
jgi:hypothetical protein